MTLFVIRSVKHPCRGERAVYRGAGLRRRLASHLALPLRRGDGDGAVVIVVAAGLLADEVLDLATALRLPVKGGRLKRHAPVRQDVLRAGIQTSSYAIHV